MGNLEKTMEKAIRDYKNIDNLDQRKYLFCYTKKDVEEVLVTYIGAEKLKEIS